MEVPNELVYIFVFLLSLSSLTCGLYLQHIPFWTQPCQVPDLCKWLVVPFWMAQIDNGS